MIWICLDTHLLHVETMDAEDIESVTDSGSKEYMYDQEA